MRLAAARLAHSGVKYIITFRQKITSKLSAGQGAASVRLSSANCTLLRMVSSSTQRSPSR